MCIFWAKLAKFTKFSKPNSNYRTRQSRQNIFFTLAIWLSPPVHGRLREIDCK